MDKDFRLSRIPAPRATARRAQPAGTREARAVENGFSKSFPNPNRATCLTHSSDSVSQPFPLFESGRGGGVGKEGQGE